MDNVLDRLDTAIKEYLTSIDTDALDDTDHRRLSEILAFTTNLEHAGDIVEKSLMPLAAKRIKRGVSFSETSRQEIHEMMDRLIGNARAAAAVFMTEDPRAARQLLGEKEVFRELELRTTEEYFGRARAGRAENIEMGKLLLDIVRDLKRVNAHLAAAAYPVLEGARRTAIKPAEARLASCGVKSGAHEEKKAGEKSRSRSHCGIGNGDCRCARRAKNQPPHCPATRRGAPENGTEAG
jgi:hypothetical protein